MTFRTRCCGIKDITRYHEFSQWLDYLLNKINENAVDVLIVAGDIFDTTTPSAKSQKLYFNFLNRLRESHCRHTIIIGGNHDSAALLDAPQSLLSHMGIHVVGRMTNPIEDEIIVLRDSNNQAELVVCAIPYLHEKDIRNPTVGESLDSKDRQLIQGLHDHYEQLANKAVTIAHKHNVPLIATGHLFMTGGKTSDDDGVRDLYVGNEAAIKVDLFSEKYNYIALGHLHIPQKVAHKNHIRYCGSPIAMGFGEARQNKLILYVEFDDKHVPEITEEAIPVFQQLARIKGDYKQLNEELKLLKAQGQSIWVDVTYNGQELEPD